MLSSANYVFFWFGPLSNWHKGTPFGGERAFELATHRLDAAGIDRPPNDALSSRLIRAASFNCGEQWMMACKVWLCDRSALMSCQDEVLAPTDTVLRCALAPRLHRAEQLNVKRHQLWGSPLAQVLRCREPKQQKAIGRSLEAYDDALWSAARVECVTAGTIARLSVDRSARAVLLDTGSRTLVEGSPYDRVWGVGLRYDDPRINDPRNWRGLNLLGASHDAARTALREIFA